MDERPEIPCTGQPPVLIVERKIGAEKKIANGILVKHAVDQQALGMTLKVDPVILCAIPVERPALPRNLSEPLLIQGVEILRQKMKLREQLELEILRQRSHFGGADLVEDDLEHDLINRAFRPPMARREIFPLPSKKNFPPAKHSDPRQNLDGPPGNVQLLPTGFSKSSA
jgi:hypothetical protein